MDMLLGLDMLKKHQVAFLVTKHHSSFIELIIFQCTIDLRKNCLMIGTTGTETKFLSENELPACARYFTFYKYNCSRYGIWQFDVLFGDLFNTF